MIDRDRTRASGEAAQSRCAGAGGPEGEGRGEFAELLSLHFFHAGDAEKSYRYSLVAGERAQEKFANVEAAGFYRRAVDLAPQLELDASVDGIRLRCDQDRLVQVLVNLLQNAHDAMRGTQGGRIRVSALRDGVDLGSLYELAEELAHQGVR